ncbi:MAG TPA: hypothetical protein HPP64_09165 [Gammaproteobacteria bacterium]|nr:hypothetical protein [Gammaproteobacteria bacterium]HIJ23071.1 hypothetical protein [Gammaproteobacteria bacterium]
MKYNHIVGIDPGSSTGVAKLNVTTNKLEVLQTLDFWSAYNYLDNFDRRETLVVIEVPTTKTNWHGNGAAIDVGGVIREAKLLADGIERLGFEVIRVHPRGKVPAKNFNKITGWVGRSNEHNRDAGMLAWSEMKRLTREK